MCVYVCVVVSIMKVTLWRTHIHYPVGRGTLLSHLIIRSGAPSTVLLNSNGCFKRTYVL